MSLFDEDRLKKKDADRYSHLWVPDRWAGDCPSGNNKAKQFDLRSAEEKAESHKRWALTEEERAENDEKYKLWFQHRKNAKGLW
jgi:hypothetical protein|tara:strand:+ start:91 stop:342 length:252 start_codon:yes stop_codon:yes gene_type:complete